MSGVVTPEAVRLEFEAAGVGSRAIAFLMDLLAQAAVVTLLLLGLGLLAEGTGAGLPDWVGITITVLAVFAVFWGYPVAFETLWRGRTPGKAAMGLRVVTREGAPVRFRHAVIRAALGLVDFYATSGAVAVVSALVTREHQRLGDLVAGTLVLRQRTGARPATPAHFAVPSGAESYAATIDPSGLSVDDYAAVRGFLLRAGDLAPDVRADLARRLARPLAARVRHRPPPGVSPELFLRCAAARYQQRGDNGARTGAAAAPQPAAAAQPAPPEPAAPQPAPPEPAPPEPAAPQPPRASPASDGGFAPPG